MDGHRTSGTAVEFAVGPHGNAIGLARIAIEEGFLAVLIDLEEFPGGNIGKVKVVVRIKGHAFGKLVATADDFELAA